LQNCQYFALQSRMIRTHSIIPLRPRLKKQRGINILNPSRELINPHRHPILPNFRIEKRISKPSCQSLAQSSFHPPTLKAKQKHTSMTQKHPQCNPILLLLQYRFPIIPPPLQKLHPLQLWRQRLRLLCII
jgi:hypothetical protein